jgi:hypothetical protein
MDFDKKQGRIDFLAFTSMKHYSISKSVVSLLPSPCRAKALSSARRLDTNDLEKELHICWAHFCPVPTWRDK